jgi:hypothetical protein
MIFFQIDPLKDGGVIPVGVKRKTKKTDGLERFHHRVGKPKPGLNPDRSLPQRG